MKTIKRYQTETEILEDIEKWRARVRARVVEIEGCLRKIDALSSALINPEKSEWNPDKDSIKRTQHRMEVCERYCRKVEGEKLAHLKQRLSEIRTPVLMGVSEDPSVPRV